MSFGPRPVVWMNPPVADAAPRQRFGDLRAWLLGEGPRPPIPAPPRRPAAPRPVPIPADLPRGAALVVVGWSPWEGDLPTVLARRPDLRAVAVPGRTAPWDWPEYADPGARPTARAVAALARAAALTVWPDAVAAARFAALHGGAADTASAVVEPEPSVLADTGAPRPDAALASVPYVVAVGPVEARANTSLLLQLWRAALAQAPGGTWPRLVLAGARGRQVEEVAPLLDWNGGIRAAVVEAPNLPAQALRDLLAHARGLLAADFALPAPALLRDAVACGIPVLAADTAEASGIDDVVRLDPLDGPGWRRAIAALAGAPPAGGRAATASPLSRVTWRERIEAHARGLA